MLQLFRILLQQLCPFEVHLDQRSRIPIDPFQLVVLMLQPNSPLFEDLDNYQQSDHKYYCVRLKGRDKDDFSFPP